MFKAYQFIFLSEFQLQTIVQFQFQIFVVILGLGNDRIRIELFDLVRSLLRDNPVRNTDSVPFYLLPVSVAAVSDRIFSILPSPGVCSFSFLSLHI